MANPLPITVSVARQFLVDYGYDQIVIYARKTGPEGMENMTTCGISKEHSKIAALMGVSLKKLMGWENEIVNEDYVTES